MYIYEKPYIVSNCIGNTKDDLTYIVDEYYKYTDTIELFYETNNVEDLII